MPVEAKLTRVEENSPIRCQALGGTSGSQCPFMQCEGSNYCPMHGGNKNTQAAQKERIRRYRLGQWEAKVSQFAEEEGIKSLRDEIGILRMTLESIVVRCTDETELLIAAPRIGDMILKIEKLVSSCHRLETSTGMLLDKGAALNLAGTIVNIIGQYITDPATIDIIANEIALNILGEPKNNKDMD